jgi:hypothetical protein
MITSIKIESNCTLHSSGSEYPYPDCITERYENPDIHRLVCIDELGNDPSDDEFPHRFLVRVIDIAKNATLTHKGFDSLIAARLYALGSVVVVNIKHI